MKSLQEFSTELDIYLNSLLDILRTRYYNVSVNRGSEVYTFFYSYNKHEWGIGLSQVKETLTIPTTELLTYFESKQTPPQIKELLK
jgi:hypothetical protein